MRRRRRVATRYASIYTVKEAKRMWAVLNGLQMNVRVMRPARAS